MVGCAGSGTGRERGACDADRLDEVGLRLIGPASRLSGMGKDAIFPENLRRAVLSLLAKGMTEQELLVGAETGRTEVVESLRKAVSIGETYFFRHPEQFQQVARLLLETARASDAPVFRAWSAGCATG